MRFPASDRRAYARPDPVLPEPLTGCPVGFRFGIQPALELCSRHQVCLSTLGFTPPSPQQLSCFFALAVFSSFCVPVARCLAALPYGFARFGVYSARPPFSLFSFAFALPRFAFWARLTRTPASVFCPCELALNSIPDYLRLLVPLKGFNPSLGSRCLYSDNLSVSAACTALKSFLSDFRLYFQRPLSFQCNYNITIVFLCQQLFLFFEKKVNCKSKINLS